MCPNLYVTNSHKVPFLARFQVLTLIIHGVAPPSCSGLHTSRPNDCTQTLLRIATTFYHLPLQNTAG